MEGSERKYRSEETWWEVRRAWERGETAASLALRYDVGLANLWRRRAAEGWQRRREADPAPAPLEGWDRYAQRRMDEFEAHLTETRDLARQLCRVMRGDYPGDVSVWHLGFLLIFRAEHLGPETAAADRKDFDGERWAPALWDATGALRAIPGAHREPLHSAIQRDIEQAYGVEPSEVPATAVESEPGDVVVVIVGTWHAAFGGAAGRRQGVLVYYEDPDTPAATAAFVEQMRGNHALFTGKRRQMYGAHWRSPKDARHQRWLARLSELDVLETPEAN